ncbi:MAG: hypothetical protein JSV16_16245 [Candidatus Hydrogenedentota bacterium]|nr:MAG: hypothetical protein JSV16_16245 [Candidatus Hydrogenedentota bacterium]
MSHVHLVSGENSIRIRGLIYPHRDELDLGLAVGVSESGEVYISRKGAPALTLVRLFAGVRDEEHEALRSWYTGVSEGSRNTFMFIDADGSNHTVRWINGPLDWQKDGENRWSGLMRLRVEGFEP